jgi:hypothetical protein
MGANPHPLLPDSSLHSLVSLKTHPVRRLPTLAAKRLNQSSLSASVRESSSSVLCKATGDDLMLKKLESALEVGRPFPLLRPALTRLLYRHQMPV